MIIDKLNFIKDKDLPKIILKVKEIISKQKKGYACVVNTAVMARCFTEEPYKKIITDADFNFCDGIIAKKIYNFTQKDKVVKISGPDFFFHTIQQKGSTHFFLGGTHEISEGLFNNLKQYNSEFQKSDFFSPPFLPVDQFDYPAIAKKINAKKPDFIWLSFGNPKQEIFASKLLPYLDKGFMITVGAAFGFYSGIDKFKNAPHWVHQFHLVWLYRALQEPRRIIPRHLKTFSTLPRIIISEIFH